MAALSALVRNVEMAQVAGYAPKPIMMVPVFLNRPYPGRHDKDYKIPWKMIIPT